jgi:hypothetical protein
MRGSKKARLGEDRMFEKSSGRLFYRVFIPIAVALNLGLGIFILSYLGPNGRLGWLEVTTGAFCCIVAGWLAASAWSKSYWGAAMARQITAWRQIADAIFAWLEEAPLPAEALQRLKGALDEAAHQPRSDSV